MRSNKKRSQYVVTDYETGEKVLRPRMKSNEWRKNISMKKAESREKQQSILEKMEADKKASLERMRMAKLESMLD